MRLQRWVEAEGTKAAPMAHGGARDTGDPLSDDSGQRATMGGDQMEPERQANAGLPPEGRRNADDNAPYGDQRTDAQAFGPQVDAGREAPTAEADAPAGHLTRRGRHVPTRKQPEQFKTLHRYAPAPGSDDKRLVGLADSEAEPAHVEWGPGLSAF